VNNGHVHAIDDDVALSYTSYNTFCQGLDTNELSDSYVVTVWYADHGGTGVNIAASQVSPSGWSFLNTDASNPPTSGDSAMTWILDAYEFGVYLEVGQSAITCTSSIFSGVTIADGVMSSGTHAISVTLVPNSGSPVTSSVNVVVNGVGSVSVSPSSPTAGSNAILQVPVSGSVSALTAIVTSDMPESIVPKVSLTLVDDGTSGDPTATDGQYGGTWSVTQGGWYTVTVQGLISNVQRSSSARVFVQSSAFDVSPASGSYIELQSELRVHIPSTAKSWGYNSSIDGNHTVCAMESAKTAQIVTHSTQQATLSYTLKGDIDARLEYPTSMLPKGAITSMEICLYVNDVSDLEEDGLAIWLNNASAPVIIDDSQLTAGVWQNVCIAIPVVDIVAEEFFLCIYYKNRLSTQGVQIGLDKSVSGMYSFYDASPVNRETNNYYDCPWILWTDDADYMAWLKVDVAAYHCPPFNLLEMAALTTTGPVSTDVWVEFENGTVGHAERDYVATSVSLALYPKSVRVGNELTLTVSIAKSSAPQALKGWIKNLHTGVDAVSSASFVLNNAASSSALQVYDVKFTPSEAAPYRFYVSLDYDGTTTVNRSIEFGSHYSKAAFVYSPTTHNYTQYVAATTADKTAELFFMMTQGQIQRLIVQAGLSYDVINEKYLSDPYYLGQYDQVIFTSHRNAPAANVSSWITNVRNLVQNQGMGCLAVGELWTVNEYGVPLASPNEALNQVLNLNVVGRYSSGITAEVIASNVTHPSAWRFAQDEVLGNFSDIYSSDLASLNGAEYTYPYNFRTADGTTYMGAIATTNGKGRVWATPDAAYIPQTIAPLYGLLFVHYGDKPQFGMKWHPRQNTVTIRVDADITYNLPSTLDTLPMYRNVTEAWGIIGGWYLVNCHSNKFWAQWESLRSLYYGMEAAGHSLGSHSYTHPGNVNELDDDRMILEMNKARKETNQKLHRDIKGFVNPGAGPRQLRLWNIAQLSQYELYSGLDYNLLGALGYIDDTNPVINFQENYVADYDLLIVRGLNYSQTSDYWKGQFDFFDRQGDGAIHHWIWHEYPFDDQNGAGYDMFANFTKYVGQNFDFVSETPETIARQYKAFMKQHLNVTETSASNGGYAYTLQRTGDISDRYSTNWAHVAVPRGNGQEVNATYSVSVTGSGVRGIRWSKEGRGVYFQMTENTAVVSFCPYPFGGDKCEACAPNITDASYPTCTTGKCGAGETCSGVGQCTAEGCLCPTGLMGLTCDVAYCPQDCNRRGNCTGYDMCECHDDDVRGHWTGKYCSTCKEGWGAPNCTGRLCEQSGCNGRGSCVSGEGKCSCIGSYNGSTCADPVCSGGCGAGQCVDVDTCRCNAGFQGTNCEECASGFYGSNCSQVCPDCGVRGTCNSGKAGNGQCSCNIGWNGTLCETETVSYPAQASYFSVSLPATVASGATVTPVGGNNFIFALRDYEGRNTSAFGSFDYQVSLAYYDGSTSSNLKINAKTSESYTTDRDVGSYPSFILSDSAFTGTTNMGYRIILTGPTFSSASDVIKNLVACNPTCGEHGNCAQELGQSSVCVCEAGYSGAGCDTAADAVVSSSTKEAVTIVGLLTGEGTGLGLLALLLGGMLLGGFVCVVLVIIIILIVVMYVMNRKARERSAEIHDDVLDVNTRRKSLKKEVSTVEEREAAREAIMRRVSARSSELELRREVSGLSRRTSTSTSISPTAAEGERSGSVARQISKRELMQEKLKSLGSITSRNSRKVFSTPTASPSLGSGLPKLPPLPIAATPTALFGVQRDEVPEEQPEHEAAALVHRPQEDFSFMSDDDDEDDDDE
jgi:hypothetical protein